ncbi:MAG: DUF6364 family protein [Kiritimatiellae bacterium]|nr:DUF6364 family protein [Kiritimatiellia bacterium]
MKTRITLTVDPGVSHRAKDVARREGLSLSALVEKMLKDVSGDPSTPSRETFSQRWRGRMELTDISDERTARLKDKYKLNG